ncbi:MAG TPA: hypothetical protein VF274_02960 [Alphaproteobacteria bacterium]|jgi:hypothetical protein
MEFVGSFLVGFLVFVAVALLPLWKIFGKTGMSPWLSLLVLIPGLGGLICVVILAFGRWPALDGGGR